MSIHGAANAQAQDAQKWYAGANVGQSKFSGSCGGGLSCDTTDTAFKFFGGYKFSPMISAELGYADFGKQHASGTLLGVAASADVKVNAWELDGVGSWPIANKFSVLGRLGVYRAESKASGNASFAGIAVSTNGKASNTGLTYGIGAGYDITQAVTARLEFQRYNKVGGNNAGGKNDVDVISIGALFKF
jgi:OOP family OmpA-OmpF porin